MSGFGEFLKKQKLKMKFRPYTFYPNQKILYVTEFKNGFATALVGTDITYWGFAHGFKVAIIDSLYRVAASTPYACGNSYNIKWVNGHIPCSNKNYAQHSQQVFLDRELKEVPDKRFLSIKIHHNYFIVGKVIKRNPYDDYILYGILDSNLKEILAVEYNHITPVSPTRFYCRIDDDKPSSVFDADAKKFFTLEGIYRLYDEAENGYYKFQSNDDSHLYGYFNRDFNIVITPKYDSLGDFDKNGFAPFSRGNIIGVVNMKGEEIIR